MKDFISLRFVSSRALLFLVLQWLHRTKVGRTALFVWRHKYLYPGSVRLWIDPWLTLAAGRWLLCPNSVLVYSVCYFSQKKHFAVSVQHNQHTMSGSRQEVEQYMWWRQMSIWKSHYHEIWYIMIIEDKSSWFGCPLAVPQAPSPNLIFSLSYFF